MYIEPSTTIKIYHNVPLDNTYVHTIYFDSISAQNEYFHGNNSNILKRALTKQSFQRASRGVMRVEVPIQDLYDCNYMAFQNERFGAKWFYAFITGREYVNNVTSEITFELDSLQTYWDEVTLLDSFVEREHSETDTLEEWLIQENIETGEYVNANLDFHDFGTRKIAMSTPFDLGEAYDIANSYLPNSGVFTGINYKEYDATIEGGNQLATDIADHSTAGEEITSVDIVPSICGLPKTDAYSHNISIQQPSKIGEYTPKNKKLLCFPFCFLLADNNMGTSATYKFEYFDNLYAVFSSWGNVLPTATVWTVPRNYKGIDRNYNETIVSTGFPSCPFNIDTFLMWKAQNKNTLALNATVAGIDIVGGIANVIGGDRRGTNQALSGALQIANIVATYKDKQVGALQTKGKVAGDAMISAFDRFGVDFYTKTITESMAKIVDEYFEMYGYACNRVKTPSRNNRPHWTYVKTVGINIEGNCPSEDLRKISNIYDNGITFWRNPSEVGNYSLDNSPQ